jgi:monofunctional biosynthetic peptidoglycan transglycosylase
MSRRTEPTLHPVAPAPLTAERRSEPVPPHMKKSGMSVLTRLLLLLLACVALLLMPVILLKWLPPPTTAFMLQSPVKPVRYSWVPASKIAEVARRAVIAAEDQKFRTHNGFDVEAIEKAYEHNRKARHKRGASTISQQTAKNLFLWPGGGYFRKGVEAGFTVLMENIWGKDRILEVYLNVAEFGPGIYGVEAASQAYFHKPASQLSAGEAARLAAVLPNPRHWSVTAPGAYVQARSVWIVGQMGYGHRDVPADEPELPAGSAVGENQSGDDELALPPDEPAAPAAPLVSEAAPAESAKPQAPQ